VPYNRISSDSHIGLAWLPGELFTPNASAAPKDRMPHVVDGPSYARSLAKTRESSMV
jgi:hypothetical protein